MLKNKRSLGTLAKEGQVDLPRLLKAGVRVQFFAIFIESCYKPHGAVIRALQGIDVYYRELEANAAQMGLVFTREDLDSLIEQDKLAAILAIEGGEGLGGDLSILRIFHRLGVRSLGLTWNQRNDLADGVGEQGTGGGLTNFGRQVVQEMNRLGMIVDLAHIAEKGFWDVLDLSTRPVIVSHANCRGLCDHPRNLNDSQMKSLAEKGGCLGITFVPDFLGPDPSVETVADHIEYAVQLMGIDHVGLGSDFDGVDCPVLGLESALALPNLVDLLGNRGFSEEDVAKIMGGNWLRILRNELPWATS
ncbi:MAG TPA: membrane dipeptidase [Clostridia bacterium]|nr:membrane dipeptidase [Clostridia bacterium]